MSELVLRGGILGLNTISAATMDRIQHGEATPKVVQALDYLSDLIFHTDRLKAKAALAVLYSTADMTSKQVAFSELKACCRAPNAFSCSVISRNDDTFTKGNDRSSGEREAIILLQIEIGFGEYLTWVKKEGEDNYQAAGIMNASFKEAENMTLAFRAFGNDLSIPSSATSINMSV